MAICEQCGKEHEGTFGSGRFCCRSCSNKWVALHQSEEAKARKIEKGKKNLKHLGYNFSAEDRRKGGRVSASIRKSLTKEKIERIVTGKDKTTSVYHGGYARFRDYLIEHGYKERKCEVCGLTEWMGFPIPIELHHIDSDGTNNELSNLQILCPNCHAQTPSHGWNYYNNFIKGNSIDEC